MDSRGADVPPDAEDDDEGLPAWGFVTILVLVVAFVLGLAVFFLGGLGNRHHTTKDDFMCTTNLIWIAQTYSGARPEPLGPGGEPVLVCPKDAAAHAPETAAESAACAASDLATVPRALCSYAMRDLAKHPITPGAAPEPVAACLHHPETFRRRGRVIIAFSDGIVRALGYEELGVSSSADVTVGPASKAPLLRTLIYGDGSVK